MLMDEWWEVEFSFKVEIGWFKHVLFVKMNTILKHLIASFYQMITLQEIEVLLFVPFNVFAYL